MAEVVFARNFLATLEPRPIKLSADHVEDPKNFPARPPYILPKMPKAFSKPASAAAAPQNPGQQRSLTVHLKSLRNPPLDVKLTSQPLNTSVLDLKAGVAAKTGVPVEKMKLLHQKRPVPDSKVLKELVAADGEAATTVEMAIMVVGGAAAVPQVAAQAEAASTAAAAAAAAGTTANDAPTGTAALETDAFWEDLRGFLMQRLKDEKEAGDLTATWRQDWQGKK